MVCVTYRMHEESYMKKFYKFLTELRRNYFKNRILKRYANTRNPEIRELIETIRKENELNIFNYDFYNKYKNKKTEVQYDEDSKMYYVIENGRRLYFKRSMCEKDVIEYYRGISAEQDEKSPHRYVSDSVCLKQGDCVLDLGAAEGNFVFQNLDKIAKAVLVECDKEWVEALKMTFKNYKHIKIINQKVSGHAQNGCTTLDELGDRHGAFDFIKMDLEAMEAAVLGGQNTLKQKNKFAVCTYHRQKDFRDICRILKENGYKISHSDGFMTVYYSWGYCKPYIRRGIVRAKKG